MADDARLSTALPRHPKTVKLKRRLGGDGCWALVCLFLWVADNRADGDLAGMSVEDIEIAADWGGDQGLFAAVLTAVGFLDGQEGSYSIHDWAEHNPFAATRNKRVEAAKEANRIRWSREREAKGIRTESESDTTRTEPDSPPPHHTTPHHTPQKTDSPADVITYLMQELGMSGRESGWLLKDAAQRAMEAHDLPAMGAAARIVTEWDAYQKSDVEFKCGIEKFLRTGLFLSRSKWGNGKPVGKFTQLLATVSEPYSEPGEQFGATRDRQS